MTRFTVNALRSLIIPVFLAVLLVPATARGQEVLYDGEPTLAQANIMRVAISQGGDTAVSQRLNLKLGKSAILELPIDAADVLVSNPSVADAIIRTPRRIYILGLSVGGTNAFFFDDAGGQILNLEIRVERDIQAVQDMIDRLIPDGRITVEALQNNIVLTGHVRSAVESDRAVDIAARYVGGTEQVMNALAITGGEQVLLKVRIVEMQRTVVKQLGINLTGTTNFGDRVAPVRTPRLNSDGDPILDQLGRPVFDTVSPGGFTNTNTASTDNAFGLAGRSLGGLATTVGARNFVGDGIYDDILQSSLELTFNALERVGLVRTLAEPNLTAISGEAANFLAGGEFPVPGGRDRNGNVQVEYKPFGVALSFTPLVMDDGRISLFVSTEVSELTDQGSLELSSNSLIDPDSGEIITIPGVTLPGLKVRRAETTLELPSGGSMVMAGLIQDRTQQNIDGTPGAKDVPGLGALFRARDTSADETELVVVVTPYLVAPSAASEVSTPGDGFEVPGDFESIFLGRLNRVYAAPGAEPAEQGWRGPIGFILDEGDRPETAEEAEGEEEAAAPREARRARRTRGPSRASDDNQEG